MAGGEAQADQQNLETEKLNEVKEDIAPQIKPKDQKPALKKAPAKIGGPKNDHLKSISVERSKNPEAVPAQKALGQTQVKRPQRGAGRAKSVDADLADEKNESLAKAE